MIVEFIGSTGAGKTTLIKHIVRHCERERIGATVGTDFVLQQSRLSGVKSHRVRAVFINLVALLASLAAWPKNLVFYRFALQIILALPGSVSWLERLLLAKNILKRIGIYETIRRHGAERQIYLVDEGTLHVAHSLFVHLAGEADGHGLPTFAGLAPLPEAVVYLRHDEAVLVERLLARGHPRVPDRSLADAERFVRRAVNVFDELVQHPAIEQKVIVVDSARNTVVAPDCGRDPFPPVVAKLVQAVLHVSAEEVYV
jgi:hypothetical protein